MKNFTLGFFLLNFTASLFAQDPTITINSDNLERSFIIHFPNGQPQNNLPVVIVMHGDGGDGQGIKDYCGFDALSDAQNFVAVYPNSTNVLGMGIWNKEVNGNPNDGPDDVKFIKEMIEYLCGHYDINRGKVYATGHSGGAFMAYHLAVALPDQIAAIAPIAGNMYGDTDFIINYITGNDFIKIPVYHIQGDSDQVVAYPDPDNQPGEWDEWPLSILSYPNCGATTYQMANITDLAPTVKRIPFCENQNNAKEVLLIRVVGGGHEWPNAEGYDPAQSIWNFFNQYEIENNDECTMAVNEMDLPEIKIYPNPVLNELNLNSEQKIASIELMDLSGKKILTMNGLNEKKIQLNLYQLNVGIYIIKMQTIENQVITEKIVKK